MSNQNKSFNEWIKENENKWVSAGIILVVCAVTMPFIIYFASKSSLTADSFSKLGTVGDFLGGTTVGLLSLASILFLISTIVMQRKELEMQREELQMTRQELIKSNEQYAITNETMKLQQFETTYFNMINMHGSLINDLKLFGEDFRGREVIIKFYEDIFYYYKNNSLESYLKRLLIRNRDNLDDLAREYTDFYYSSKYYHSNKHTDFSGNQLIEDSRGFVMGKVTDELGQEITVFNIFKLKYDDFKEGSLINYDGFSRRINDEFFDEIEYKITAFRIVNDNKFFPLSNYIKSVKTIIGFVDESNFDNQTKNKYLNIFFSQFSIHEIVILNYYIKLGDEIELDRYFQKYESLNTKETIQDSLI